MNICKATGDQIPGLLELLRQVGQVHHGIRPDIFPATTLKYDADQLSELLGDAHRPVFIALEGAMVTGYCFCQHRTCEAGRSSTGRRELYIDDLCVHEDCRGQGIAKALYHHVLDYAAGMGFDFVTLNVWNGNDGAMRFYEKLGLRPRSMMMETRISGDGTDA